MDKVSPETFRDRVEEQNHISYDFAFQTEFIRTLSEDRLDKNRFYNWISGISPFVFELNKNLDASAHRAEITGNQKLTQRLKKRVDEEKFRAELWDKLRDSIGFSRNKIDYSYSQEHCVFNLNNWLWTVNSNVNYSIPEGIASIYSIDVLIAPLAEELRPNLVNIKSRYYPRANLGWFDSYIGDDQERRIREDIHYLSGNYYSSPLANKILDSVRITQQLLCRVFEAS